jgi:hypothetical protein
VPFPAFGDTGQGRRLVPAAGDRAGDAGEDRLFAGTKLPAVGRAEELVYSVDSGVPERLGLPFAV